MTNIFWPDLATSHYAKTVVNYKDGWTMLDVLPGRINS